MVLGSGSLIELAWPSCHAALARLLSLQPRQTSQTMWTDFIYNSYIIALLLVSVGVSSCSKVQWKLYAKMRCILFTATAIVFCIVEPRRVSSSVADLDPGSGAFLTPGSGIWCFLVPWIWIRDIFSRSLIFWEPSKNF